VPACKKTKAFSKKSRIPDGDLVSFKRFSELSFSVFTFWCDATGVEQYCMARPIKKRLPLYKAGAFIRQQIIFS